MRILLDCHHQDLYYSLQLLFQKRLGFEVYRQIGLEWYKQGLWNIYPHPATANQYLSTDNLIPYNVHGQTVVEEHGKSAWLNKDVTSTGNGIFSIPDYVHHNPIFHLGITLDTFKDTKFDILLCSIPVHLPIFRKLKALYQPQAKIIFQAGNNFGKIETENLLTSAKKTYSSMTNANTVFYHQEFDVTVFKPQFNLKQKSSISNLQHIAHSIGQLLELKKLLPTWNIKAYGAANPDGPVDPLDLPNIFNTTGFTWHVKLGGDGYGYNIFQSFACGTPMIINKSFVNGQTADDLFLVNKTIIDINHKSNQQIVNEILNATDNYELWHNNVYNRFKEVVNFDQEEILIRKFIENLK